MIQQEDRIDGQGLQQFKRAGSVVISNLLMMEFPTRGNEYLKV
jgi:hypothetical protein